MHAVPALIRTRFAGQAALALALSVVIAVAAHVAVPFYPVPMTLQTLAVLAIAAVFGPAIGTGAMVAYLIEGAIGLPVFATGAGVSVLVGPTGGYLLGMLAAAALVGRSRGAVPQALSMLAGTLVIYALGAAWLSTFVGWDKALAVGVTPFVVGDLAKAALAWCLARVLVRNA